MNQMPAGVLLLERLKSLSDGVVAVVITLLVLGIDVPQDHHFSTDGLPSFLGKIEYQLFVYAVSFALVGTYWLQHNAMFHYLRYATRTLIWLNLAFLFVLTLIPFATDLIGTYRNEPLVMVIFTFVNVTCGLSLVSIWWYANRGNEIVWPKIDPHVVRSMTCRILLGPLICLFALAISFLNVRLSHVAFLTIPFVYASHSRVDSHWSEIASASET